MTSNSKLVDRARDELFSHINRCGVIQAADEDQGHWMDETIDYLGERYPDLSDGDLRDLHAVGLRFCQPAISRRAPSATEVAADETDEIAADETAEIDAGATAEVGAAAEVTATATTDDTEAPENTPAEDVDANAA